MVASEVKTNTIKRQKVRIGDFGKRLFDIVVSIFGLIFLSPVFLFVSLYLKRTHPGSIFYRGNRVGLLGKQFKILKFSTMADSPEFNRHSKVTARDDPRITSAGRWLRATKINELPNLWNVLKGDMSMVGPRPEDPDIAATWTESERAAILSVRPGLTSPASIFYRDEENLLQTESVMEKYLNNIVPSKLRLDQIYVKDHNFLGDLDILFMTIFTLLPGIRNQPIPESILTYGPLSRLLTRHVNLFLFDVPIAFIAVGISGAIWRTIGPLNLGWGPALLLAIVIALLFGIVNALLGMNRISWAHARVTDTLGLAISTALTTVILFSADWFSLRLVRFPIGMWIMISLLAFFGFVIVRFQSRLLLGLTSLWIQWRGASTRLGERVLIVGAGEMAQIAAGLFRQGEPGRVLHIIGMVDDDSRKMGLSFRGIRVIGTTEEIPQLVEQKNIGVILFAINNIPPVPRRKILSLCRQTTARIVLIPDLLEMLSGCLFAPALVPDDIISPGWEDQVPISEVVKWLTEFEALAYPENDKLLARLRKVRDTLAAHLTNDGARLN